MEDSSFIYFTQDDVISKIDIDTRLVDSFKRVMKRLQDYFNIYDIIMVIRRYIL